MIGILCRFLFQSIHSFTEKLLALLILVRFLIKFETTIVKVFSLLKIVYNINFYTIFQNGLLSVEISDNLNFVLSNLEHPYLLLNKLENTLIVKLKQIYEDLQSSKSFFFVISIKISLSKIIS